MWLCACSEYRRTRYRGDAFHLGPHDLRASTGNPNDAELQEVSIA